MVASEGLTLFVGCCIQSDDVDPQHKNEASSSATVGQVLCKRLRATQGPGTQVIFDLRTERGFRAVSERISSMTAVLASA